MKVLIISGTTDTKAEKISKELVAGCKKRGMNEVEAVAVNLFTSNLKEMEERHNPDVIVRLTPKSLAAGKPVVDGMPLVYAFMGPDKVYNELKQYYK